MRVAAATIAVLISSAAAAAEPPPFSLVRADEDYSYLRNSNAPKSWEDAFKYIPLGGDAYLSLGGELRERLDVVNAPNFGIGTKNDTYVLQRLLLHADMHLGSHVRIFAELGQHDAFDKGAPFSAIAQSKLNLQVGFVDITPVVDLTIRLGRQEMSLNPSQRFVAVREGPNVRQSFDGARVTWHHGGLKVDVFAVRPILLEPGVFHNSSDKSQGFWGINIENAFSPALIASVYMLGVTRDRVRYGGVLGNERRQSFGGHVAGRAGAWDYDVEGMAQFGSFSGRRIHAWGASMDVGYTLNAAWRPRIGLRFDSGSGDQDARDGVVGTFNPLFPKGAYFNESSLTSWSNLLALRPSLRFKPTRTLTVEASVILRWRENINDAVYLQPSVPLAPTLLNHARYVGAAYALDATWKATRNLSFQGEFVHQTAGPAISAAGGHSVDFAMLITQVRF